MFSDGNDNTNNTFYMCIIVQLIFLLFDTMIFFLGAVFRHEYYKCFEFLILIHT